MLYSGNKKVGGPNQYCIPKIKGLLNIQQILNHGYWCICLPQCDQHGAPIKFMIQIERLININKERNNLTRWGPPTVHIAVVQPPRHPQQSKFSGYFSTISWYSSKHWAVKHAKIWRGVMCYPKTILGRPVGSIPSPMVIKLRIASEVIVMWYVVRFEVHLAMKWKPIKPGLEGIDNWLFCAKNVW